MKKWHLQKETLILNLGRSFDLSACSFAILQFHVFGMQSGAVGEGQSKKVSASCGPPWRNDALGLTHQGSSLKEPAEPLTSTYAPDGVPQCPVEQRAYNNRLNPTEREHSHGTPGSGRRTGGAKGPQGNVKCVCVSKCVCATGGDALVVLLRSC